MDSIRIRPMVPADLDGAMAVLGGWNMAPAAASAENPDPERASLEVGNSFVAVAGGEVVGVASFIHVDDEWVETASLAVAPAVKGKGVGFRLQAARLEEMRRRGYCRVRTETDRPETVKWYVSKFGYRVVGTNPKKHSFSLADVDSWTVLELELDGDE